MSSHDNISMHTAQSFSMSREDFLRDLYSFMSKRGQPIYKVPSLGYQELDLFVLYTLVIQRGGMDEVTRKQEWKLVYQDLGIPTMSTSASYNTRTNYKKYLYLYELEHCDFSDRNRPKDAAPKYQVGEHIRIVSSVFEGQVFYAKILKYRYKDSKNQYYVHYNGWNSSHDEWMREDVVDPLLPSETRNPEMLPNPAPSRSSKSNHLILDANVPGKVLSFVLQQQQSPVKVKPQVQSLQHLSPISPAVTAKRGRKLSLSYAGFDSFGDTTTSEEEEAATDLLEMTIIRHNTSTEPKTHREPVAIQTRHVQTEFLDYPMRSNVGKSISSIVESRQYRPHEADLIHRNRIHTHILIDNGDRGFSEDREREIIAVLLSSIQTNIPANSILPSPAEAEKQIEKPSLRAAIEASSSDPRELSEIEASVNTLQSTLLSLKNEYKHTMHALKRYHNVQSLPASSVKKASISTRRSERS